MRLQKYVSDCGLMSRRAAEKEIEAGSFTVNGEVAVIGQQIEPEKDIIKYKGTRVRNGGRKYYIALNKPAGYVTTANDEMGRQNVCELVSDINARLYPVGRLDRNSEGLLIFTNDGQFANDIMHPSRHVPKTYRVTIDGMVNEDQLSRLMSGVELDDGVKTLPCTVEVLTESPERTVLRFVIKEGRNRQIRRMCSAVGLEVGRLRRTAVGGVKLGMLKPGDFRDLTKEELRSLRSYIGKPQKKR